MKFVGIYAQKTLWARICLVFNFVVKLGAWIQCFLAPIEVLKKSMNIAFKFEFFVTSDLVLKKCLIEKINLKRFFLNL